MNVDKFNNIVSTFVSKECNAITESQQGLLQVDNRAQVSEDQIQNLHLLTGSVFIEAWIPIELKWIYQINFCCESFAQLQKKNVLQLWESTFFAQCFLNIDSCPFREGTKIKLSHQHWIFAKPILDILLPCIKKLPAQFQKNKCWKLCVFYLYYEQTQILSYVSAYILNQVQNVQGAKSCALTGCTCILTAVWRGCWTNCGECVFRM